MSTKAKRHVHKYQRVPFTFGNKVWACRMPDCNHYMPKHLEATVEGKNSVCWQCDEVFPMDADSMIEDKPRCLKCRGILIEEETFPLTEDLKKKLGIH